MRDLFLREVDGIRMLHHWLLEWVSLQEMERQGVISCHFPCPNVEELSQIHNAVLAPNKWLKLSFQSSSILLRHYFGEDGASSWAKPERPNLGLKGKSDPAIRDSKRIHTYVPT